LIHLTQDRPAVIGIDPLSAMLACVGRVNLAPFLGHPAGAVLCLGVRTLGEKLIADFLPIDPALSSHYPSADLAQFDDWSRDHAA
jgi:hypothetical protein